MAMNENNLPVIGIDLDDVLFDFMGPLSKWHNDVHGTVIDREEYHSFDLKEVWQCAYQEALDRVWNFYQSDHYRNAMPIPGALDVLKQLQQNYRLVIVTARPETMEVETRAWLASHFPEIFDEIIFTNHYYDTGVKRTKSSVCLERGVQVFVEDALHNALDVAGAGIPVLLFDTPWNREVVPKLIHRVSSWQEVFENITRDSATREE